MSESGGQTKVTNLDGHVVGEEEIAKLEITVDDVLAVDVVHPGAERRHVVACLRLRHRHATLEHVDQRLPAAVLQHDVDIVTILEMFEKLNNILVSQRAMKLDFTRNFFFVMRF